MTVISFCFCYFSNSSSF